MKKQMGIAFLVLAFLFTLGGTGVAQKNARLKERVATLETRLAQLEQVVAEEQFDTATIQDGRYFGILSPDQVRGFQQGCQVGDDATWEGVTHPNSPTTFVQLGC